MRPYFDRDRSLLKLLLTIAADAVRQLIAIPFGELRVGMIYTCHTFGRDLVFKPHVHLVVTNGGLDKGRNWVAIDRIPRGRLAATWRYSLCQRLRQWQFSPTDKEYRPAAPCSILVGYLG